nr:DNA polymerase III subunit alpha [Candidatus Cloacimonas sp.]
SSISYIKGFYYKPRISKDLLQQYNQGLICLSACVKGEIPALIHNGRLKQAKEVALWYKDLFQDRFYIELQNHSLEPEKKVMPQLIELARELKIPMVLTNDCHYLHQNDYEAHDILLCIQTGKLLNDPERMRYGTNQLYFKSPEEMREIFPEVPEAYTNTLKIAEMIDLELHYDKFLLPNIETPPEFKSMDEYLRYLCYENAKNKYSEVNDTVNQRIEYELEVIDRMGFNGYFLIVKDIVDNARKQNVPVGPGRGSGAGSIVAYLLDITQIDPLKYGLVFERFLNPDRISMPDIDIDFCAQNRSKVIDYIVQRYGRENVTQIITFSTLQAKSVIKDVARVLSVPAAEANAITKTIPGNNRTLEEAYNQIPEFAALINSNEVYQRIFKYSKVLEGLVRQTGVHAAGVVIAPGDLTNYVPLACSSQKGEEKVILVQFEGKWLNDLKLLKMDILGLKNLTLIQKTIDLVKQAQNIELDINHISLDDKKVYNILGKGETDGVFQFESDGMRKYLIELKPNKIEDLIAMVALYRPGPIQFIETFINRKHGREKVVYDHPLMENALKETYGVTIYQEQVMQIAREMGDFTGGEADSLRKAMGKKDSEYMQQYQEKFQQGAKAKNVPDAVIDKIWQDWLRFAEYAFNKSHATCYALVAYQTAYLKAYYPVEFMAALLSLEDDPAKIPAKIEVCKKMGIKIIPPNINRSDSEFRVHGKEVLFGLRAIKNLGDAAMRDIIEDRKQGGNYNNIFNFCSRLDSSSVNKTILESLIASGAMDELEGNRAQKWAAIEQALQFSSNDQKDKKRGQSTIFDLLDDTNEEQNYYPPLPTVEPWSYLHQLEKEKEVLGFYLSGHPLFEYRSLIQHFTNADSSTGKSKNNGELLLAGIVTGISKKKDSKGNPIAFMEFEDLAGKFEVPLFNKDFNLYIKKLVAGKVFFIIGTKSNFNGNDDSMLRVLPNAIIDFADLASDLSGEIKLNLRSEHLQKNHLAELTKKLIPNQGKFKLITRIQNDELSGYQLESRKLFFPNETLLNWMDKEKMEVQIRIAINGKTY